MLYLLFFGLVAVVCYLLDRLADAEHRGYHKTADQNGKVHWVKDEDES